MSFLSSTNSYKLNEYLNLRHVNPGTPELLGGLYDLDRKKVARKRIVLKKSLSINGLMLHRGHEYRNHFEASLFILICLGLRNL